MACLRNCHFLVFYKLDRTILGSRPERVVQSTRCVACLQLAASLIAGFLTFVVLGINHTYIKLLFAFRMMVNMSKAANVFMEWIYAYMSSHIFV